MGSFNTPNGIVLNSKNNLIVADRLNNRIRMVTPEGIVTTLAGSGHPDFADGDKEEASFFHPFGVAVDISDNVVVTDSSNRRIRMLVPSTAKPKKRNSKRKS